MSGLPLVVATSILAIAVLTTCEAGEATLAASTSGWIKARENEAPSNTLYDQCITEDAVFTVGSCMLSQECSLLGGSASGSCAQGLGTCCIVKKSCNSEATLNNTYFVSGKTVTGACTLFVRKSSEDICQLRLDFVEFHISQPDADGHCTADFMTVEAEAGNIVPTICGSNNGQHMYVDFAPFGEVIEVIVDISVPDPSTAWKIQVSQIPFNSTSKAPDDCLQYHTETAGVVKGFNFDGQGDVLDTRQIAHLNYGVCVKKAPGYCGIIWTRDQQPGNYSFTVSNDVAATSPDFIGTPAASSTGDSCLSDYVVIPEGVTDEGVQADRYCGLGFPNQVLSTAAPFTLHVRTDGDEGLDGGNQGFQLRYRQTTIC
ncbi:uncharacterized protein [Macrobrachium rosenbergii]